MPVNEDLVFKDAKLVLCNFSGRKKKFNPAGTPRSFGVLLDTMQAKSLMEDGWCVKQLPQKESANPPSLFLPVSVMFGQYLPRIARCTSRNMMAILSEETVDILDSDEIVKASLVVRPRNKAVQKDSGVVAYLEFLYIVVDKDTLDSKDYLLDMYEERCAMCKYYDRITASCRAAKALQLIEGCILRADCPYFECVFPDVTPRALMKYDVIPF